MNYRNGKQMYTRMYKVQNNCFKKTNEMGKLLSDKTVKKRERIDQ